MRIVFGAGALFFAVAVLFVFYNKSSNNIVCEEVEIIEIVSAKYRSIDVKLSNGFQDTIYQPSELIAKGTPYKYCKEVEVL